MKRFVTRYHAGVAQTSKVIRQANSIRRWLDDKACRLRIVRLHVVVIRFLGDPISGCRSDDRRKERVAEPMRIRVQTPEDGGGIEGIEGNVCPGLVNIGSKRFAESRSNCHMAGGHGIPSVL